MKKIYQIPETEIIGIMPTANILDASGGEADVMSNKNTVYEEVETTNEDGQKPGLWED